MPVCIPQRNNHGFVTKGLPQNITVAEKKVRDVIAKTDRKGEGYLGKEELTKIFKEFGSKMPSWRAELYLKKHDTNHDGKISGKDQLDALVDYIITKYKLNK